MRLLFVCLAVVSASALDISGGRRDPCRSVECRAGRECIVEGGAAQCQCVAACPDRYQPVCGSDDRTYDSHCNLHRHACLTGNHIKVTHKGVCKTLKFTKKRKPAVKKEDPAVCYSSQRDAYLLLVGKKWRDTLSSQPWHVDGMTFRESLWGRFYTCDKNKDNYLDSDETLNCTSDTVFMARPNQDRELTRALCVDAIVDMGDTSRDWRLDFEEFTTIFTPGYRPPQKRCSLEGKKYVDGEDVQVDGSHCICAVGSWVCTSPTDITTPKATKKKQQQQDLLDQELLALNDLDYDGDLDDEEFLINEEEDEEFLEDLFDDLLDKLHEHRLKNKKHHHNRL
ncbi:follistatin-related protein 1-like [Scylla paramamosain]|uniref:follistatin-related protein 1-like n=1 Tax=Scylla paramamosain TaxID=85552 RepID=UPI00308398D0